MNEEFKLHPPTRRWCVVLPAGNAGLRLDRLYVMADSYFVNDKGTLHLQRVLKKEKLEGGEQTTFDNFAVFPVDCWHGIYEVDEQGQFLTHFVPRTDG